MGKRLTEHQKCIQDKLRKLSTASRMIATYEAEIRYTEDRMKRADKESAAEHKKRITKLKAEMKAYQKDADNAKKIIDRCPDGIGKRILIMRYLQLMRMEDIAVILSYDRTYLYRLYYATLDGMK